MFTICSYVEVTKVMAITASSSSVSLAELRRMIQAASDPPAGQGVLPFGIADIDEALPGGGIALGAVHEFSEDGPRGHYASCASLFAAGILARLHGPVLWCLHSRDLFAPALAASDFTRKHHLLRNMEGR
jgi:protein ImuA